MKPNRDEKRYQVPKERRLIAFVIDYVPGYAFLIFMVLFFVYAKNKGRAEDEGLWAGQAGEGGGYLGILNANPALIESISNESGTLTGDFSTRSLVGPTEHAQWLTDGPVVVSTRGEVLGTLSTLETSTTSLFNESIYVQVPFMDRCEACIGSLNDNFSTDGPKIYDSQAAELKEKIGELTGQPLGKEP